MNPSIVTALLILTSGGQSHQIQFIDAKSCAEMICDQRLACEALAKDNLFFPKEPVAAKCITLASTDEFVAPAFFTGPSPWHKVAVKKRVVKKRRHR